MNQAIVSPPFIATQLRVLAVIPARGGSKGVPRKNARLLGGRPLIEWTVAAALGARTLSRVIITTDDEEIAALGRAAGAEVPFLRPAALARDDTPMLPVIQHAVGWTEERGEVVDAVCILQPTNPLRRPSDIDDCVDLIVRNGADSVMSVLPVPHEYNPHWVYEEAEDGGLRLATGERTPVTRRQELPRAWHREGAVYVMRRDVVMRDGTLYGAHIVGYPMDPSRHVNIDDVDDWARAEQLIAELRPAGVR
ncbi:MAG TPA: acylneuraminate cytidylyltransferase family protein [Gemmatimonadaceae bacterium]